MKNYNDDELIDRSMIIIDELIDREIQYNWHLIFKLHKFNLLHYP